MKANLNNGVIIRHLRKLEDLNVREFSKKIGRSHGWLSDVENCTGKCHAPKEELDRIVEVLGAAKHRPMFRTWVASSKKFDHVDRSMEGAVLKHVRLKRGLTLDELAAKVTLSKWQLSRIENGHTAPTVEQRKEVLTACGYSPSSFKNLYFDPERSKRVSARFKLDILLNRLPECKILKILEYAEGLIEAIPGETVEDAGGEA